MLVFCQGYSSYFFGWEKVQTALFDYSVPEMGDSCSPAWITFCILFGWEKVQTAISDYTSPKADDFWYFPKNFLVHDWGYYSDLIRVTEGMYLETEVRRVSFAGFPLRWFEKNTAGKLLY